MNFSYLTHDDWRAVFDKYPGLESRLGRNSLYNEMIALKKEREGMVGNFVDDRRKSWIEGRIKELEDWWLNSQGT